MVASEGSYNGASCFVVTQTIVPNSISVPPNATSYEIEEKEVTTYYLSQNDFSVLHHQSQQYWNTDGVKSVVNGSGFPNMYPVLSGNRAAFAFVNYDSITVQAGPFPIVISLNLVVWASVRMDSFGLALRSHFGE